MVEQINTVNVYELEIEDLKNKNADLAAQNRGLRAALGEIEHALSPYRQGENEFDLHPAASLAFMIIKRHLEK